MKLILVATCPALHIIRVYGKDWLDQYQDKSDCEGYHVMVPTAWSPSGASQMHGMKDLRDFAELHDLLKY